MIAALFGRRHTCETCGESCGAMMVCDCEVRAAIECGGISLALLLMSAVPLMAQTGGGPAPVVNSDQLVFTLPVFTVCMLACIGFTWVVARYESDWRRRFDEREVQRKADREQQARQIQVLQHELRTMKERMGRESPRGPEGPGG
jgi:type VI protein secretion system component VasK